ncbi:MAG TPA: hypothetical protein VGB45_16540 [Abditibacterium sp.]|jgi:hypothetical protein
MTALKAEKTPRKPAKRKTAHGKISRRAVQTAARRADNEVNLAPQAWGRRVARLVGEQFGVKMVSNRSKNEGERGDTRVVIKCAKSQSPPIFISVEMLARVDEVWGVFLIHGEGAQIWSCSAAHVKRCAHFSRNPKTMPRAEITLKKIQRAGTLLGTLSESEIEECHIP